MVRDDSRSSAVGEPNDDATSKFDEGLHGSDGHYADEGLTYDDFDFGPSDDEVRATLQPGRRSIHRLEFSDVIGDDWPDTELADNRTSLVGVSAENDSDLTTPSPRGTYSSALIDSFLEESREKSASSGSPDFGSNPHASKASSGEAGHYENGGAEGWSKPPSHSADDGEQETRDISVRKVTKRFNKAPMLVVLVVAVLVVGAVVYFGGFGSGYWAERVELGTVDFVDWRTGNPVRPSEELTVEKGDKREYFAPNVAGYKATEARANGKRFKLSEGESGKSDSRANIIEGLSPWPEDEKSEITILYAKRVEYTVSYVEDGSNENLAPSKVVEGKVSGEEVTEKAISIDGYEPVSDPEFKLTLLDANEKNTITFTYAKAKAEEENSFSSGSQASSSVGRAATADNSKGDTEKEVATQAKTKSTKSSSSASNAGEASSATDSSASAEEGASTAEEPSQAEPSSSSEEPSSGGDAASGGEAPAEGDAASGGEAPAEGGAASGGEAPQDASAPSAQGQTGSAPSEPSSEPAAQPDPVSSVEAQTNNVAGASASDGAASNVAPQGDGASAPAGETGAAAASDSASANG